MPRITGVSPRTLARTNLGVLALLCLAACSNDERGEVIVIVSSDMALPSDIDWLDWSVTRVLHPERAPEQGSFALDQAGALPATLAIVSSAQGAESVQVTLDARSGLAAGTVRVHREARFTVPAEGQRMLKLPLNWLCSDVNLAVPCPAGTTCQAGECVDSHVTEPLVYYEALEPLACFDALQCTMTGGVWRATTPSMDDQGNCTMDPSTVLGGPLSVALIVNPDVAGNAGVCAPSSDASASTANPAAGLCVVPVNQDNGPDGYQLVKNDRGQTVIRLPTAVCAAVARGTVKRVASTRTDPSQCPTKTAARSLCPPSGGTPSTSSCVASSSSCPDTFMPTWTGYSCSGTEHPSASNLSFCAISDNDPENGPVVRGHFCCTSEPAPGKDPLLIDDMSGGPLVKFRHAPDETAGTWFTSSDDVERPISPPQQPQTLFPYRVIDPVTPPGGPTIDRAACFRMSQGFSGFYALEGFNFSYKTAEAVPVDVSRFSGITFWATLTPLSADPPPTLRVMFANRDTDTEHESTCNPARLGKTNCNHFGKTLSELTSSWQKFTVTWDELTQSPGFGMMFDTFDTRVYSIDFEALGPGAGGLAPPFDFCVSQIGFTP